MSKFDLYETITQQIIEMLEKGVVPWRSPIMGRGTAGHPTSMSTGKKYRGVNVFLLAFTAFAKGYQSAHWVTFKEALARGGNVKKGEKSSMIVYFKKLEAEDKVTGEKKEIPLLRYFSVFNVEQCDGIEAPDKITFTPSVHTPIEAAEAIIQGYKNPPAIQHGGSKAFYVPSEDRIQMPEPTRFTTPEEYYATRFHEMAHSSGHSTRLDRKLDTEPKAFGTPDYSAEELVAEMASCYLTARCGISPPLIENQAAYIAGWTKILKGDSRAIISAASKAQKAADWILDEASEASAQ
jgi:antirestriction protein ArdC